MNKLSTYFWPALTVLLSIVFATLFYPVAEQGYGEVKATLFTLLGLIVIWLVYAIRVFIFSRKE